MQLCAKEDPQATVGSAGYGLTSYIAVSKVELSSVV